jgi:EAL domain-containing protein (putative c-di-GMP-specific phosphodiesterase class I)
MKAMGVRLAIDDFGTGYSSLGYLRTLPVDIVKIDKSFVERVDVEPEARGVIEAVVHLARTLQLETVAEGVETGEQAHHLAQLGCDRVQGFHYSRPLPGDDVVTFLGRRARPFAPEVTRRAGESPGVTSRNSSALPEPGRVGRHADRRGRRLPR